MVYFWQIFYAVCIGRTRLWLFRCLIWFHCLIIKSIFSSGLAIFKVKSILPIRYLFMWIIVVNILMCIRHQKSFKCRTFHRLFIDRRWNSSIDEWHKFVNRRIVRQSTKYSPILCCTPGPQIRLDHYKSKGLVTWKSYPPYSKIYLPYPYIHTAVTRFSTRLQDW